VFSWREIVAYRVLMYGMTTFQLEEIAMDTKPLPSMPKAPHLPARLRNLIGCAGAIALLPNLCSNAFAQTPANWTSTQDMSRACQISFPPSWRVTPDGQATAADGGRALVTIGSQKALEPLSKGDQKLLQVDRLIENTASRVFYLSKPQGDTRQYIADQQFKGVRCVAQIFVSKAYAEDEVVKIVATMRPKN
jgi:hypothetical protein